MGLFNHICRKYFSKTSKAPKSLGLLAVADKLRNSISESQNIIEETGETSTKDTLESFFEFFNSFCSEIGLEKCTVLFPENNLYKAFYSYGFEDSINDETISTSDFWNGTLETLECSNNGWYSLSEDEVNPFFQLFSYDDQNLIHHLHIKKIEEQSLDAIIIVAETTKKSLLEHDTLESISEPLIENLQTTYKLVNSRF